MQAASVTLGRGGEGLTGSGANSEGVLGESPAAPLCLYLHYHIHQGCLKPWFLSSVISPTTFLLSLRVTAVFLHRFLTFRYSSLSFAFLFSSSLYYYYYYCCCTFYLHRSRQGQTQPSYLNLSIANLIGHGARAMIGF